jgi:hypothetical protein
MKRPIVLLAITTAVLMVGCGSTKPTEPTETPVAETTEAPAAEATQAQLEAAPAPTTLGTPEVKDGVSRAGEDCAEVYFEWAPIEGADGYEVSVANKYFAEKDYREPETVETTEANYVDGAQDYFDFQIKVRAFAGEGSDRTYGEWSSFAEGSVYEKKTITAGGPLGELSITVPESWTCEVSSVGDDKLVADAYGFILAPDSADEGHIEVFCSENFGVCGTGLKSEEIELAGLKAHVGTYDEHEHWDFIIIGEDQPQMIAQTVGCDSWFGSQFEEAQAVLDTLKLDTSKTEG